MATSKLLRLREGPPWLSSRRLPVSWSTQKLGHASERFLSEMDKMIPSGWRTEFHETRDANDRRTTGSFRLERPRSDLVDLPLEFLETCLEFGNAAQ